MTNVTRMMGYSLHGDEGYGKCDADVDRMHYVAMLQTGLRAARRAGLVWPRYVAPRRHRVAAVPCYRAP
eukprot:11226300-Lingulodinium_polyedra.AAC.1